MKKRSKPVSVAVGVPLLVLVLLFYGVYWLFFDIQRIRGQTEIASCVSPDATYTVTAYRNNGGATTDFAVLCTVKNNITGKERNIYWNYHCRTADIRWLDRKTVCINGVELNVKRDIYDWRRE